MRQIHWRTPMPNCDFNKGAPEVPLRLGGMVSLYEWNWEGIIIWLRQLILQCGSTTFFHLIFSIFHLFFFSIILRPPATFNISTKTIHINYFISILSTLLPTGFTWIIESLLQASKAWMVELLNICLIRTNLCFSHAFCTFSVTLKLPSSSKLNVTSSHLKSVIISFEDIFDVRVLDIKSLHKLHWFYLIKIIVSCDITNSPSSDRIYFQL